jgi:hypothetical protein
MTTINHNHSDNLTKTIGAIKIRPYQVMCLICRLGKENDSKYYFEDELDELQI